MAILMKRRRMSYKGMPMAMRAAPKYGLIGKLSRSGVLSRSIGARVHTFKRCGDPLYITNGVGASVISSGNTALIGGSGVLGAGADPVIATHTQVRGSLKFQLAQLAGVSEITNLFDNYRIKKVKLSFLFSYDSSQAAGAGTGTPAIAAPVMYHTYDPDDDVFPATTTSVLQHSFAKTTRMTREVVVWLTPRAQNQVVGGGTSGGGLLPVGSWLDCDSAGINHYGLKFVINQFPQGAGANQYGVTITPTYYIEAKNIV